MKSLFSITLSSVSEEYEEVEFYYTNAINVGLNKWNSLNNDGYISDDEQKMMDEAALRNLQKKPV